MQDTPRSRGQVAVYSSDSPPLATEGFERLREALADQYEIAEEVGRGGTAHVFRARDLRRQADVALKVLRPEFAAAVTKLRFLREIELVSSLEHPNVLPLLDSGSVGGEVYFTMPLLKGRTLRDHLQENGALPIDQVIAISRDIASALDYAHARGVIHRDIKPSNTLLEDGHTYVADFGIARAVRVASGDELTDSGISIGTPEYMSPEQGMGSRQLDRRCDVYSLGCVVYHMLSGAPPFTGPTSQAIIARHCIEPPPPLHVVRPTVSEAMERVIERALAKIPADRYDSAGEFVSALEAAVNAPPVGRRKLTQRRVAIAAVFTAAFIIASVIGLWFAQRGNELDGNRFVVFPLTSSGLTKDDMKGEDLATVIGYTLEWTRPLRWILGSDLLGASWSDTTRLTVSDFRRLSRNANADYFIDGAILGYPDSVIVRLQLSSVNGDTAIARSIVKGKRGASIAELGLSAVQELMAVLLPANSVDISPFMNRKPESFVNFLLGEREYRRMEFSAALGHYIKAVHQDSSFALAAVRGAQAADWLSSLNDHRDLVDLALKNEQALPAQQQMIARGLRAYMIGDADSAVYYLDSALAIEPSAALTWMMLGEVYARLLPSRGPADSLAEDAFKRARDLAPNFAPALIHLERLAFGRGDTAAVRQFREELKRANADTTHAFERGLMTRCLQGTMSATDWDQAVRQEFIMVLEASMLFSAGAKQPRCARAALEALLRADSSVVRPNYQRGSLLILEAVYDALGYSFSYAKVNAPASSKFPLWTLSALHDEKTNELDDFRRRALDSLSANYEPLSTGYLWYLGLIASHLRDTARLASIERFVVSRAEISGERPDRLVATAMTARLSLLRGDSTRALKQLQALKPTASRNELTWRPWESLASERMLLAELLLAQGKFRDAIDVATWIEAPASFANLYWLRASLQLRARAADQLRDTRSADRYRARLSKLDAVAAQLSRAGQP